MQTHHPLSVEALNEIARGHVWAYERVLEYWANTGQHAKLAPYLWAPADDECCGERPSFSALACEQGCVELICGNCGSSLGERHTAACGKPNTYLQGDDQ
jgi:hypothetical protein